MIKCNLLSLIYADLERICPRKPNIFYLLGYFLLFPPFRAVVLYRIGHSCFNKGRKISCVIIRLIIFHTSQCEISLGAKIGPGLSIRHSNSIVIGGRTVIGKNFDIRQGVTLGGNMGKKRGEQSQPTIGDNVIVGAGAKILGPIIIGDNVTIGANAVVVKDTPSDSIIGGVPAKDLAAARYDNKKKESEIINIEKRLQILEEQYVNILKNQSR